jgi:putative membrane protein
LQAQAENEAQMLLENRLLATKTAKIAYLAGVTLLLTSLGCWVVLAHQDDGQMSPAAKAAMADQGFAKEAAQGGMAEIKLGQLAQDKGSNESVKSFGARMVTEHSKAGDHLKEAATKEHIALPTELAAKDQSLYDYLSKLSGPEFDRAYAEDMVKDHRQDLQAFQREASRGKDDLIRGFASETIPMIQEHLNLAKEMHKAVSPTGTKRTSGHGGRLERGR